MEKAVIDLPAGFPYQAHHLPPAHAEGDPVHHPHRPRHPRTPDLRHQVTHLQQGRAQARAEQGRPLAGPPQAGVEGLMRPPPPR